MKIGTNITATIAAQSLAKNQRAMAQSMQRLSTGLKINSAADDAAGLAMVDRMTAQSRGLSQAVQNANDAIGMIQTAEGAIASVTDMLQRMRELSVQSASDTNTSRDRLSLDLEYQALKTDVDRVFSQTQWNGENLLDGSYFDGITSFQVGAETSQTIELSMGNLSLNTLGGSSGYGVHPAVAPALTEVTAAVTTVTLNAAGAWTQRGADLNGDASGDNHGFAVSLSKDGNILAVGGLFNDDAGPEAGQAKVYSWNGTSWQQMGSDIDGQSHYSYQGFSVSLSDDGQTLAVGAIEPGASTGSARIFRWDEGSASWVAKGSAISGEGIDDWYGSRVKLSADGDIVAISGPRNDGAAGTDSGHVRVYSWNGSAWEQRGTDIEGESANDRSGDRISLSEDGSILAIGAAGNDDSGDNAGHVRVYQWDGSTWQRLGDDIDGESAGDGSYAVSLSSDGLTLAVGGGTATDSNGDATGHVKVYSWNGSAWVQMGSNIEGDDPGDYSGFNVSLSDDGSILSVVAPLHDNFIGHGKVYKWDGNNWVQIGNDIDGGNIGDGVRAVSLTGYGNTVALGSRYNDDGAVDAGEVRVFDWPSTTTYTPAQSQLDFSNLDLITGDRVVISVAGGTEVQGILGEAGLDQLATDLASQIALQTGLYGTATASAGIITITGLADGNAVSGLSVSLERNGYSQTDSVLSTAITSATAANSSLAAMDRAITRINSLRAGYGATMNRLEYAIDNLTQIGTNTSASRSRIEDANYAREATELARTQIIQQAATAMLAQANQQTRVVMDILNWDK